MRSSVVTTEDGRIVRRVRSGVDRDEALAALPEGYGTALRLHDEGRTTEEIAASLDVDIEVVASLLRIGQGKLRRVLDAEVEPQASEAEH
jgi:DNA-directed RNA polymerase specialized sigma24 family protein